jgi:carboxysome shell carbonic anhydrase
MNTLSAYGRTLDPSRRGSRAPFGLGTPTGFLPIRAPGAAGIANRADSIVPPASTLPHPACDTLPGRPCRHPLADFRQNEVLAQVEDMVKGRFDAIAPALRAIAAIQHEGDFVARAQAIALERLGFELPETLLDDAWVSGLDMKRLYAHCVFRGVVLAAEHFSAEHQRQREAALDARNFFLDCGFHAVDVSPCADGRLKGLLPYVLRVPMSDLVTRKSYAGAMFDVEANIRHWMDTELRRFREGFPVTADAGTRYLKIAVYHTSSSDARHEGCAAHGSNERDAAESALTRLNEFRQAIQNSFCCGASVDILLIGVDTDTDAIKIHVPDGRGDLSLYRLVDNAEVYRNTLGLSPDAGRLAVYDAIQRAPQASGWSGGQGEPHDGIRRLIANLMIQNLSQIEYVGERHGGRYPDIGHAERFIVVGDGFEEVQMRNVTYYAHLHTVEEGAADLDVGVQIFTKLNVAHGLPIPVAIHYRYDGNVPGARRRMATKCRRIKAAIEARYPQLVAKDLLVSSMSVQDRPVGSPIEPVDEERP